MRRIVHNEHTLGVLRSLLILGTIAIVYLSGFRFPDIG